MQIGSLAAIPVLVLSLTSLLWGALSDAFRLHSRILSLALLLSPITVLMLSRTDQYPALANLILVYALFSSPIVPLLASVFLLATTTGAVYAFYRIYMDGIGAGEGSIGLGWALAAVSEIPVMIFSGEIMRRIGAGGFLYDLVGMAALYRVLSVVALAGFALFWLCNLPGGGISRNSSQEISYAVRPWRRWRLK